MKNILAENLLRFGVKNLSESDIKKLHEQDPNGRLLPVTKVTARSAEKTLQTSFKTDDNQVATWSAKIKMDPTTKKWNIKYIQFQLGDKIVGPLRLDNNQIQRGEIAALLNNGEMGYTGPGMSPLASLNSLINQISKQTGVQYGINVDLKNTLSNMPNRYFTYKTSVVPKGSYLKPGIEFGIKSLVNPDTNQVINRTLFIGDKYSSTYQIVIDANGKLKNAGPNSIETVLKNLFQSGTQYLNVSPSNEYAKDDVLKSIKSLQYQTLM